MMERKARASLRSS